MVWLSTTGDVLDADQQAAFERYIRAGGGYVGVHAASDTEYDWPWYGDLVGAYFSAHPANQQATIKVEDPAHPSTAALPARWSRFDEWYNFQTNPRGDGARAGQPGRDAPTRRAPARWAPTTRSRGARTTTAAASWYTGSGHTIESYAEPPFLAHLLGGIQTAAGVVDADCSRVADRQLREGHAGQQHQQPDGARHRPGRPGVLHRARRPGADHQAGHRHHGHRGRPGRLHRQRGRPDRHPARPGLRHQQLGLPVLRAQRRRGRATCCPGSPSPATRIDLASEKVVLQVDDPAQHLLPRRRQHGLRQRRQPLPGHRRQHQPVRVRRVRPDRRAGRPAGLRRAAHLGQHQRPARQDAADPPGGRRHLHRPGRQPVPAGHRADPARDLRDGLPQPVPDRHRPGHRHARTWPTTARTRRPPNPNRGPEGTVEWNIVEQPGNYGWPYCHGDNYAYNDFTFPSGPSGREVQLRGAGQQLAQQHRPDQPAAGDRGHRRLRLQRQPAVPGDRRRRRADGRPGLPLRRRRSPPTASGRRTTTARRIFGEWNQNKMYTFQVDADGTYAGRHQPAAAGHDASCGRWTSSSARTARST